MQMASSICHTGAGEKVISVAVGPDNWVCMMEPTRNRISVFDENGQYIKSFGKKGEFNYPYAIAIRDDRYICLCERHWKQSSSNLQGMPSFVIFTYIHNMDKKQLANITEPTYYYYRCMHVAKLTYSVKLQWFTSTHVH